jgi:hypothetical protein
LLVLSRPFGIAIATPNHSMFAPPRRKGRLKQLNKANRRLRRHYPESEFIAWLRARLREEESR